MATTQCGSCSLGDSGSRKISSCVCKKIGYCSIECQKRDWINHKKDCPVYMRKPVEGKGYGLVAVRNIKKGNQVAVCRNVILVPNYLSNFETVSKIMQEFTTLSEEDKDLVLSLNDKGEGYKSESNPLNACSLSMLEGVYGQYGGKEKVRKVVRVFWHWSSLEEMEGGYKTMRFPQVFMNHSCCPNANAMADGNGQGIIFALTDIKKGEEIVESYFHPVDDIEHIMGEKKERIEVIKKHGFTCCCKICSLSGEELLQNNKIRRIIKSSYTKFMKAEELHKRGLKTNANYLEIAEELVVSINKIPTEMTEVLRVILMACYTLSAMVVMEGKLPRVEPKVYKAQLYQTFKGYGPEFMKSTDQIISQTRDQLQAMGGGKYLHMF